MQPVLLGHDERLQSLRGLAALSVMIGHASLLLPLTSTSLLQGTIFEQNSAVVFFYVLSGFVLSESLRRGQCAEVFIIRRLARLLPVFWASIIFSIGAAKLMQHPPFDGASDWFNVNFLSLSTDVHTIVLNLVGVSTSINGALWSIQTELVMAPLLLILVPIVDRMSPMRALGVAALLLIVSDGAILPYAFAHVGARPVAYVYCFYLGALVPRVLGMPGLRRVAGSGSCTAGGLLLAAAFHLLMMRGMFAAPTKFTFDAIVSAQILCYVSTAPRNCSFLKSTWLVRLGDISYSFYAYGQMVLATAAFALFRLSSGPWWKTHSTLFTASALAVALVIAIPLANVSYTYIERAGIKLGGVMSRRRGIFPDSETARAL